MNITSPSFPKGAQCDRSEQEVRAARDPGPMFDVLADIARPINMVQVIRNGAVQRAQTMGCPWCGSQPELPTKIGARFVVGCTDENCTVVAQASGDTPEEAMRRWNGRAA